VVPNQFAQSILTFRGDASGEAKPLRVIQGPLTQLTRPDRVDIDPAHNEIAVPNSDAVTVFAREANGNVAPLRVIRGPKTQLKGSSSIAIDSVNDLIVASSQGRPPQGKQNNYTPSTNTLLIFKRTDSGDVAPQAVIQGDHTGLNIVNQLQVYSPKGWIIVTQSTSDVESEPPGVFIGVWSIHDNGDVAPRWKIAGPKTRLKKPRGVVLNPRNKELIVADMRANAVLTYYFPEIF
jgi:DNA-binding beta-propeller fold protein YncE